LQLEFIVLLSMGMGVLGLGGLGVYRLARRKAGLFSNYGAKATPAASVDRTQDDSEYQVSYAPPQFEWSGNSTGSLPVKTLTYNQYECMEDARYGFRIVGLPPSERNLPQPHKTRAHGLKTVASLSKHGFLQADAEGGYTITDLGLNALAVCSVRY
jgi:hypothetical protein